MRPLVHVVEVWVCEPLVGLLALGHFVHLLGNLEGLGVAVRLAFFLQSLSGLLLLHFGLLFSLPCEYFLLFSGIGQFSFLVQLQLFPESLRLRLHLFVLLAL